MLPFPPADRSYVCEVSFGPSSVSPPSIPMMAKAGLLWFLALCTTCAQAAFDPRPPLDLPPGRTCVSNGTRNVYARTSNGTAIQHDPNIVGMWISRHSVFDHQTNTTAHWQPTAACLRIADSWLSTNPDDLLWASAAAEVAFQCLIKCYLQHATGMATT